MAARVTHGYLDTLRILHIGCLHEPHTAQAKYPDFGAVRGYLAHPLGLGGGVCSLCAVLWLCAHREATNPSVKVLPKYTKRSSVKWQFLNAIRECTPRVENATLMCLYSGRLYLCVASVLYVSELMLKLCYIVASVLYNIVSER